MEQTRLNLRPERIRFRLWENDTAGAIPLSLPRRNLWPITLFLGVTFCIFAGIWWTTLVKTSAQSVRGVFDLTFVLFGWFWLLGWSAGVVILGALTALFLFHRESARLQHGRLVHVPQFGPLKILVDYDLAEVRNVRLENAAGNDHVRIRFDYRGAGHGLGDVMSRSDAQPIVDRIQRAAAAAGLIDERRVEVTSDFSRSSQQKTASEPSRTEPLETEAPPFTSASGVALLIANLTPLVGVLFFNWDLASVMVLFWAESAVIGFYTILKLAVVAKLAAIFAIPFFAGHFGGFMAAHLGFIYLLFVRGIGAAGPEPGWWEELLAIFAPVWISLAALFFSHGVSFFTNFLGRHEYVGMTTNALMSAPYSRIIVMHLVVIFGGWIIMALGDPRPALALLVAIKTAADFTAHRKEHAGT